MLLKNYFQGNYFFKKRISAGNIFGIDSYGKSVMTTVTVMEMAMAFDDLGGGDNDQQLPKTSGNYG